MKQLTKEQAIALAKSGEWKKWTAEELFHLQIRQDKLFCDFSAFHEAAEKVLKRPVYTHEFGMNRAGLISESVDGLQPSVEDIIKLLPRNKTIIALLKS